MDTRRARRRADLVGRARARTHRPHRRAVAIARSRGPRHSTSTRRPSTETETLRSSVIPRCVWACALRFGVAAVLLVCTTVIASVWTLAALSRLSGLVTDTVRDSEAVTAVTSKLSGALEREDDAVLLSSPVIRQRHVRPRAASARSSTRRVADLFDVLGPADEQESPSPSSRSCRRIGTRPTRGRQWRRNARLWCSITNGRTRCCVGPSP